MKAWPNTQKSQEYEIKEFIKAYKGFSHGRGLSVLEEGEKPDYIVKDNKTNERFGVELTSVYLNDRSVPDVHMQKNNKHIYDCQETKDLYKKRIIEKITGKINKAKSGYNISYPLILSIYANEYIIIHMDDHEWHDFAKNNGNLWDSMGPFIEIVIWSLQNGKAFSIKK